MLLSVGEDALVIEIPYTTLPVLREAHVPAQWTTFPDFPSPSASAAIAAMPPPVASQPQPKTTPAPAATAAAPPPGPEHHEDDDDIFSTIRAPVSVDISEAHERHQGEVIQLPLTEPSLVTPEGAEDGLGGLMEDQAREHVLAGLHVPEPVITAISLAAEVLDASTPLPATPAVLPVGQGGEQQQTQQEAGQKRKRKFKRKQQQTPDLEQEVEQC